MNSNVSDDTGPSPGRCGLGLRALLAGVAAAVLLVGCASTDNSPGRDRTAPAQPTATAPAKPGVKSSTRRKAPGPVTGQDESAAREPSAQAAEAPRQRIGEATYYAPYFEGRLTASGEPYDSQAMTAAHRTLPFGTKVKVTHLDTGETAVVRINDRGPFVDGRIIDVSEKAAEQLGLLHDGAAEVQLQVLGP
ncbi:septal ring lytic transglycosylase RlpA family protein [Salinicola peritrichatus]|uniref:septal ring lytic transglycosylase RlpA family protein n=1 Tax=Salinicola peritrichatus TaxID=1267424 RepID=UPI000DA24A52|nr:septal ring lytic transglycosylase RlpA family protein [Salinicola peritrichatus]